MSTSEAVITDIAIGIAIIMIGTVIHIVRHLHKHRRKRKDLESNDEIITLEMAEPPPKKTAANHLEEIKEATQKILRLLKKIVTPKDSRSSLETEKNSSSYINSTKNSKSFNKNVKTGPTSSQLSRNGSRYGSRVGPSIIISQTGIPSSPPPSLLKSHDDIIEMDQMQTSLSNELSLDTTPSSSNAPTQVPSKAQSCPRILSQHLKPHSLIPSQPNSSLPPRSSSRVSSRTRDSLNPRESKQEPKYSIQSIDKKETNDYTNFRPVQLSKGKTVVR